MKVRWDLMNEIRFDNLKALYRWIQNGGGVVGK